MPKSTPTRSRTRARSVKPDHDDDGIEDPSIYASASTPTSPRAPYVYAPVSPLRSRSRSVGASSRHRQQQQQAAVFSWRSFLLGFFLGIVAAVTVRHEPSSIPPSHQHKHHHQQEYPPPANCPPCEQKGQGFFDYNQPGQAVLTPEHVAWISFIPSMCQLSEERRELPAALNETVGRELGLFGAAHLGPSAWLLRDDEEEEGKGGVRKSVRRLWPFTSKSGGAGGGTARDGGYGEEMKERRNREVAACVEHVEWEAARQLELFMQASGDAMTKAQKGVVRGVLQTAKTSALMMCRTKKELRWGW